VPELNEAFQRREREIAATVATVSGLAARLDTTAMRRRHGRQAGLAASALVGAGAILGGVLLLLPAPKNDPVAPVESPSPSATASSLETPTPPASEAPTPQAALTEGFAPVPQLPADQIPWGEVGPGWFLVDYHVPTTWDHGGADEITTMHLTGEAVGGLSLLSPDGRWYAARSFQGTGAGLAVGWDGKNAWLASEVADGIDSNAVSGTLIDLQSGANAGRFSEVPYRHLVGIDPGRALAFFYQGNGTASTVSGPAAGESVGCSNMNAPIYGPVQDDWSFQYLPADTGAMVCFTPRTDGRTDVVWLPLVSPSGAMTFATFKSPPDSYVFLGWVTDRSFVFGKLSVGDSNKFEQVFTYNVDTNEISPIDVPALVDHGDAHTYGYFDRQSQRFVVPTTSPGAWSVQVGMLDGSSVATLSGDCASWADVMTSGNRLVVSCGPTKQMWLYSLIDGAPLGQWAMQGQGALSFFDFPER
jgi:hypothetical protein